MESQKQSNYNTVSQLALRVALQTMKERCLSLQQRLSTVEEENQSLRGILESDPRQNKANQDTTDVSQNSLEVDNLRSQVSELSRQKVQLSDHINMVANENRKLWSRLSQIAKDQQGEKDDTTRSPGDDIDSPRTASQHLIRSRTFTQHTPNPNLRLKVINFDSSDKETDEPSLEEVLLVEASDDDESSNRELKSDETNGVCETELGFTYLNVHASVDDDFNIEAKKCLEGLHKIRLEALQQQLEITTAISSLEKRFVLQGCSECAEKSHKPEMIDKSILTDDSSIDTYKSIQKSTDKEDNAHSSDMSQLTRHIDFIQRKLEADEGRMVCPMCGSIFDSLISFDEFRGHVESHFLDEVIEHNFELISHSVGDF